MVEEDSSRPSPRHLYPTTLPPPDPHPAGLSSRAGAVRVAVEAPILWGKHTRTLQEKTFLVEVSLES